jgi:hypothetical protein
MEVTEMECIINSENNNKSEVMRTFLLVGKAKYLQSLGPIHSKYVQ